MAYNFSFAFEGAAAMLKGFKAIQKRYENLERPFKRASAYMASSVAKNFIAQGRPQKWPGLSPMTLALRRKGRSGGAPKILRDTGQLMASCLPFHDMGKGEFGVGTNLKKAPLLQRGGMTPARDIQVPASRRTATQAFGRAIAPVSFSVRAHVKRIGPRHVPARPFVLLQEEDKPRIRAIFTDWLEKARA